MTDKDTGLFDQPLEPERQPTAGELAFINLRDNFPEVLELFEKYALELRNAMIAQGKKPRGSAQQIFERMRWEAKIAKTEPRWKLNNNARPYMARWLAKKDPERFGDFFEMRRCQGDDKDTEA